jgi:hypothetical protein
MQAVPGRSVWEQKQVGSLDIGIRGTVTMQSNERRTLENSTLRK